MANLINSLISSASSDAEIRHKISTLPAEVSDASGLKKIKGALPDYGWSTGYLTFDQCELMSQPPWTNEECSCTISRIMS